MKKQLLSLLLFSLTCTGIACAQESLLIGSGDQIHVEVFDTPEMDQHPRVTDSGTVPLLFIGDVKVAGLTPGDAAQSIESVLKTKNYMLHPHVAVTVETFATQKVSVLGSVKSPGGYELATPVSILTVISLAGGLSEAADRNITIQRHGDPSQKVNFFVSNSPDQAFANSVKVYPGDTVIVPKAGLVYVLGDVARPGGFAMSNNSSRISVLQALALAGYANKTAVMSQSKIVRKGPSGPVELPIRLGDMAKGKGPDQEMQPDDILYVPASLIKGLFLNSSAIAASATSALIYAH